MKVGTWDGLFLYLPFDSLIGLVLINTLFNTGKMVLPFQPLTITFQDLQYYVEPPPVTLTWSYYILNHG